MVENIMAGHIAPVEMIALKNGGLVVIVALDFLYLIRLRIPRSEIQKE